MHAKRETAKILQVSCFLAAALIVSPPAFAQSSPTSAAPQAQKPVETPSPEDQLTPYQKSQLVRAFNDWAFLGKYRDADDALPPPAPGENRVVFMGDSITEGWGMKATPTTPARGEFFPGKPYINRGISGQTSPQMLVRFRQDVIDLKPKVVVILAGTNDLAENTGPMPLEDTESNLQSMSDLATANGIRVVLCSVLPAKSFWWHPGIEPSVKIVELNKWIRAYAARRGFPFVDYYDAMADKDGGLRSDLSPDGVHPNA